MKKFFALALLISAWLVAGESFAQGFDWQYSPRLPFETPKFFIGAAVEAAYVEHGGEFGFLEDNEPCCNFQRGFGTGFRALLLSEYWLQPELALAVRIGYSSYPGDFRMQTKQLRYSDLHGEYSAVYENRYESSFSYANFEVSAKRRIYLTHFFASAAVESGLLVNSEEKETERVVSPDFETFKDGTIIHEITTGEVPGLRSVYAAARFGAGYDFNLGNGSYGSIVANVSLPLNSLSGAGAWNRRTYSIGVQLMRGFLIDF